MIPTLTRTAVGIVLALLLPGNAVAGESLGPSSRRTPLVISEIMYHPSERVDGLNGEFVELHNSQPWAEDLSGYRLSGAVDFEFPANTVIPGGGFLVVASSPSDSESLFGIQDVLGPYAGQLSNDGETVRLRNPSGAVLLEIPYQDGDGWPLAADGLGHSLVLASPSFGESNRAAWAASETINGSPGTHHESDTEPWSAVVINEVSGHPTQPEIGFVEILNRGKTPIELDEMRLSVNRSPGVVIPPDTTLASGECLVITAQDPDLLLDGRPFLLALMNPENTRVLDAIRYSPHSPGTSSGRVPDGSLSWKPLATASPGSANGPALEPAIVINEIMFHAISELAADEYLELYNRSADPVDVSGWRIDGGIQHTIPEGTTIPSSGYLVIAKDVVRLRSNHLQLNATNSTGDYEGNLSNGGESLKLLRPAEWHFPDDLLEAPLILMDAVTYQDDNRRNRWADGGGSSLELIDPHSNNDLAENWGDSDESEKSQWTTVEVTADLSRISGLTPTSLQILLLAAGEMLVDDIEVFRPGSSNRVRNAGFESATDWVFQGNHERSKYREASDNESRTLLVKASGRGDPHSNRIRQTISSGLAAPGQATIRARIRWLRGHSEILFRLRGNYMEAVGRAQLPANLGTPGLQNSRRVENAPPVIRDVSHSPVLPAASEPVTVTAAVSDPDGVGGVILHYRVDISGGATGEVMMKDDGLTPDERAGDGTYSATIPGQSTGRLVAFHLESTDDNQATPATGTFPAVVPEQECLIRFGDSIAPGGFGDYRLWFTRDTLSRWTANSRGKASNEPLDVTFVYNGERAFYNVGGKYSGSFFNSPDYTGPTSGPCDYACRFYGDEPFLGATRIILSWPGLTGAPDDTAQHEQFSYWLASQLGLPFNYRRYVSVIVNGVRRGTVMEDTQRPNSDMLRQWFPGDSAGELFKIQLRYESNDAATNSLLWGLLPATLERRSNPDGSLRTSAYRWHWTPQAIGNSPNSFDSIFQLVETLAIQDTASYTRAVRSLLDIEQWMGILAVEHIVGNWDSYGYGNGQNMYAYKPAGDRWKLMIWDLDISCGSTYGDRASTNLFSLSNPIPFFPVDGDREIVGRMYEHPEFVRAYWRTLEEAARGPMTAERVSTLVDTKYNALRTSFGGTIQSPSAIKTYMRQRQNLILQQLASNVATGFEIITPSTPGILTDSSPLVIRGSAPVSIQEIRANGVAVTPRWTSPTAWELTIPLFESENEFLIEGFDRHGDPVDSATSRLSVTFTGGIDPESPNIVINEWMASNQSTLVDPADGRPEDWLELYNAGSEPIDLAGYTLTDDLNFPSRWTFPIDTIIEPDGYLLIWLDGDLAQQDPALDQWHASFSLNSAGERIGFFTPEGVRVDAVEFGPQETDLSVGRTPDGVRTQPVCLASPTPGKANRPRCPFRILEITLSSPQRVRLTWRSTPGELYVVEQSESMEPASWTEVSELVTAEKWSTTTEIGRLENQIGAYYRVKLVTP